MVDLKKRVVPLRLKSHDGGEDGRYYNDKDKDSENEESGEVDSKDSLQSPLLAAKSPAGSKLPNVAGKKALQSCGWQS